jgi:hypothetical protein
MDRSVLTAAHSLLGTPPFRAPDAHNGRKHRFRHISLPETILSSIASDANSTQLRQRRELGLRSLLAQLAARTRVDQDR